MDAMLTSTLLPTPVRTMLSDDPADILRFAVEAYGAGGAALATLIEIRGAAARGLGSHVVVAADGRFCGNVSGGCAEAAVACEALMAMADGNDRMVQFGEGSRFVDIVLPCGGGITVAIHLLRDVQAVQQVIDSLSRRQPVGLRYSFDQQILESVKPVAKSGWSDGCFVSVYRPSTRVIISGQNLEGARLTELAGVSGYDVVGTAATQRGEPTIDAFTAVVMLHHDLEAEDRIMEAALASPAFYIGALGSTRTHRKRVEQLDARGWDRKDIDRIRAPIGLFGPTRDSASLALSILGDIAACRLVAFGS